MSINFIVSSFRCSVDADGVSSSSAGRPSPHSDTISPGNRRRLELHCMLYSKHTTTYLLTVTSTLLVCAARIQFIPVPSGTQFNRFNDTSRTQISFACHFFSVALLSSISTFLSMCCRRHHTLPTSIFSCLDTFPASAYLRSRQANPILALEEGRLVRHSFDHEASHWSQPVGMVVEG